MCNIEILGMGLGTRLEDFTTISLSLHMCIRPETTFMLFMCITT